MWPGIVATGADVRVDSEESRAAQDRQWPWSLFRPSSQPASTSRRSPSVDDDVEARVLPPGSSHDGVELLEKWGKSLDQRALDALAAVGPRTAAEVLEELDSKAAATSMRQPSIFVRRACDLRKMSDVILSDMDSGGSPFRNSRFRNASGACTPREIGSERKNTTLQPLDVDAASHFTPCCEHTEMTNSCDVPVLQGSSGAWPNDSASGWQGIGVEMLSVDLVEDTKASESIANSIGASLSPRLVDPGAAATASAAAAAGAAAAGAAVSLLKETGIACRPIGDVPSIFSSPEFAASAPSLSPLTWASAVPFEPRSLPKNRLAHETDVLGAPSVGDAKSTVRSESQQQASSAHTPADLGNKHVDASIVASRSAEARISGEVKSFTMPLHARSRAQVDGEMPSASWPSRRAFTAPPNSAAKPRDSKCSGIRRARTWTPRPHHSPRTDSLSVTGRPDTHVRPLLMHSEVVSPRFILSSLEALASTSSESRQDALTAEARAADARTVWSLRSQRLPPWSVSRDVDGQLHPTSNGECTHPQTFCPSGIAQSFDQTVAADGNQGGGEPIFACTAVAEMSEAAVDGSVDEAGGKQSPQKSSLELAMQEAINDGMQQASPFSFQHITDIQASSGSGKTGTSCGSAAVSVRSRHKSKSRRSREVKERSPEFDGAPDLDKLWVACRGHAVGDSPTRLSHTGGSMGSSSSSSNSSSSSSCSSRISSSRGVSGRSCEGALGGRDGRGGHADLILDKIPLPTPPSLHVIRNCDDGVGLQSDSNKLLRGNKGCDDQVHEEGFSIEVIIDGVGPNVMSPSETDTPRTAPSTGSAKPGVRSFVMLNHDAVNDMSERREFAAEAESRGWPERSLSLSPASSVRSAMYVGVALPRSQQPSPLPSPPKSPRLRSSSPVQLRSPREPSSQTSSREATSRGRSNGYLRVPGSHAKRWGSDSGDASVERRGQGVDLEHQSAADFDTEDYNLRAELQACCAEAERAAMTAVRGMPPRPPMSSPASSVRSLLHLSASPPLSRQPSPLPTPVHSPRLGGTGSRLGSTHAHEVGQLRTEVEELQKESVELRSELVACDERWEMAQQEHAAHINKFTVACVKGIAYQHSLFCLHQAEICDLQDEAMAALTASAVADAAASEAEAAASAASLAAERHLAEIQRGQDERKRERHLRVSLVHVSKGVLQRRLDSNQAELLYHGLLIWRLHATSQRESRNAVALHDAAVSDRAALHARLELAECAKAAHEAEHAEAARSLVTERAELSELVEQQQSERNASRQADDAERAGLHEEAAHLRQRWEHSESALAERTKEHIVHMNAKHVEMAELGCSADEAAARIGKFEVELKAYADELNACQKRCSLLDASSEQKEAAQVLLENRANHLQGQLDERDNALELRNQELAAVRAEAAAAAAAPPRRRGCCACGRRAARREPPPGPV
eukprot:TRINITY_DN8110_c0_g1_i1.p1 TRINITY_DN8110_c0_g1~~TRINITY_DN8110_c0_g1_i1.p1  ORF type:complete len:1431 (-),score=267.78 TRINITY_DN8110_c0_g1_i1:35-4327(-)